MATTFQETWTDNVTVVTPQVLARGSSVSGTLDLRSKLGAMIMPRVGRGGTAALTNGVDVIIRPILNNGTASAGVREAAGTALLSSTAAANSTTVNVDSNSGQKELKVAAITGWAVGDWLCIQDSGGGVTRLEFARISKLSVASGTGVTLDRNLAYSHTSAQADTVRNKSDVFNEIWIYGGALWEVVFDYGDDSAGDSVTVCAKARTLDYISQVTV
jgi:hypothetical protein